MRHGRGYNNAQKEITKSFECHSGHRPPIPLYNLCPRLLSIRMLAHSAALNWNASDSSMSMRDNRSKFQSNISLLSGASAYGCPRAFLYKQIYHLIVDDRPNVNRTAFGDSEVSTMFRRDRSRSPPSSLMIWTRVVMIAFPRSELQPQIVL